MTLQSLNKVKHLQRRNEVLKEKGERREVGGDGSNQYVSKGENGFHHLQSTKDVAKEIGLKERSAQQYIQAARDITPEAKDAIRDTDIANSTTQLLTLARMKPEEQLRATELITTGKAKDVNAANKIVKIENAKPAPPLPEGKYSVIYADPPWPVGSMVMDKWSSPIEDKYPTMSIEEISNLPVVEKSADNCSLFLWTTHTFLPDALRIINDWGFKYFCCITWDKGSGWTQNGFHKMTELLLYAYKGKINIDQYGKAIPTLISENKTKHSKKPNSIRDLIISKTQEPRLEMFGRELHDGFIVWGNDVDNG